MIKRNYKRRQKNKSILLAIILLVTSLFGCENIEQKVEETTEKKFCFNSGNLYVNYLSVGSSDCVIIRFPNDKILVFDTASANVNNENKIKHTLNNLGAKSIDYVILSHPDVDHYGNTLAILENYTIKDIYTPQVDSEVFSDFCSVIKNAEQKGCKINNITTYKKIVEDDVNIYFLYAKSSELGFDLQPINNEIVTTEEADNLSPIILLEYKGIRFIFSGDASAKNEKEVINNYKNDFYDIAFNIEIDLTNIDYYMLSSHGKSFGSSKEFLELLRPRNAIISVAGNDDYYAPNYEKIDFLTKQDCRVLRSDYEGDIVVCVNRNGGTTLTTEYDLNNN